METANNWTPGTHPNGKSNQQNQHYANKSDTNIGGANRMHGMNGLNRVTVPNGDAKKKRKNSDKVSKLIQIDCFINRIFLEAISKP